MEHAQKIYKRQYRWTEDSKVNPAATELQEAIRKILSSHQLLNCFEAAESFGVRIEVTENLPLTIRKDGRNITVGRFFWRDGEEDADPALDLEIGKDGRWYPIRVQLVDDFRSCVDVPFLLDCEERQKQCRFAARWAADLLIQNYASGEVAELFGENL